MFDGHGQDGTEFSRLACKWLEEELRAAAANFDSDLVAAVTEAFVKADQRLGAYGKKLPTPWTSDGACVAMLLVRGTSYCVAHSGDCRVTLARKGEDGKPVAVCLTEDHHPNVSREKTRIKEAGGRVMPKRGTKIHMVLSGGEVMKPGPGVSRTFGNHDFRQWGIIPDPDVYAMDISATDLFMCLTTDGVSDVLSDQAMVDEVYNNLETKQISGVDDIIARTGEMWVNSEDEELKDTYVDDATMMVCCFASLGTDAAKPAIAPIT
jgi:serine/threonine protein phosphatase PrpC